MLDHSRFLGEISSIPLIVIHRVTFRRSLTYENKPNKSNEDDLELPPSMQEGSNFEEKRYDKPCDELRELGYIVSREATHLLARYEGLNFSIEHKLTKESPGSRYRVMIGVDAIKTICDNDVILDLQKDWGLKVCPLGHVLGPLNSMLLSIGTEDKLYYLTEWGKIVIKNQTWRGMLDAISNIHLYYNNK